MPTKEPTLNKKQLRRVEALDAARRSLIDVTGFTAASFSRPPEQLLLIAEYVIGGPVTQPAATGAKTVDGPPTELRAIADDLGKVADSIEDVISTVAAVRSDINSQSIVSDASIGRL